MIGNLQKTIIVKALRIRKARGEDAEKILESYKNLSESEKLEILELLK